MNERPKRGAGPRTSRRGPLLDRFSQRRLKALADRFHQERIALVHAQTLARAGFLCGFSDHDLSILWRAGFLSLHDLFILKRSFRNDPRTTIQSGANRRKAHR